MSNDGDIAKMEYALKNAEKITPSGKTQAYSYMKNGYNRTADTILYEKNIGEKTYFVVEAVPETNAKTLYIVSAFISKTKTKKGASQLIDANSPNATSQNGSVLAPNKSIPQDTDSVNSKFSDRYGESNRSLLAEALESVAKNDAEREQLAKYKEKIGQLNEQEQRLPALRSLSHLR